MILVGRFTDWWAYLVAPIAAGALAVTLYDRGAARGPPSRLTACYAAPRSRYREPRQARGGRKELAMTPHEGDELPDWRHPAACRDRILSCSSPGHGRSRPAPGRAGQAGLRALLARVAVPGLRALPRP